MNRLVVDFRGGGTPVHGGAAGMLYGLGDRGIPSEALLAGARPRTVAQMAPGGLQHPTRDALVVAAPFFASGGEELLVYMQDCYERWPYEQPGMSDYLERVDAMVRAVAARPDAHRFAWVPFNEPDWIWYADWAADRARFFDDWAAVVDAIRAILPDARIVGPNEMVYSHERLADFLRWASASGRLPDVISWHELTPESLTDYPRRFDDFRALERELGIGPLPVNITEYGNRRDFSHPANLLRWLAMFELTKVDADMAFWTFAGNLDDHAVRTTRANGGWWLLAWYANLTGRTAPMSLEPAAVWGVAALDDERQEVTVLVAGERAPIEVERSGVPQGLFGDEVSVTVSSTGWTGYEGEAAQPSVRHRATVPLTSPLRVSIPAGDPSAVYRIVVAPRELDLSPVRADVVERFDAEQARIDGGHLRDCEVGTDSYVTSRGREVLLGAEGALLLDVDVPEGDYRLAVLYGTTGKPARHRVLVDDVHVADLSYPQTLTPMHRGRAEVQLSLRRGPHVLSLRGAGTEVAVDRVDLSLDVGDDIALSARDARLHGQAALVVGSPSTPAAVRIAGGSQAATFFVCAKDDGYHDLVLELLGTAPSGLTVQLNGRQVLRTPRPAQGARLRVHLGQGVSAVDVRSPDGPTLLAGIRLSRATGGDADTQGARAIDADRAGTATEVARLPGRATSRGSTRGALVLPPLHSAAGSHDLVVRYANGARRGDHEYNTDVVTAIVNVVEAGGAAVLARFGPSNGWEDFHTVVVPLDLETTGGALTIVGVGTTAPNIESVSLSPLVTSVTVW